MATTTIQGREAHRFDGQCPLITMPVGKSGSRSVAARRNELGEWQVLTTITTPALPPLTARTEEDALRWLSFLADIIDGTEKVK